MEYWIPTCFFLLFIASVQTQTTEMSTTESMTSAMTTEPSTTNDATTTSDSTTATMAQNTMAAAASTAGSTMSAMSDSSTASMTDNPMNTQASTTTATMNQNTMTTDNDESTTMDVTTGTIVTTMAPSDFYPTSLIITYPTENFEYHVGEENKLVRYDVDVTFNNEVYAESVTMDDFSFGIILSSTNDPSSSGAKTLEFEAELIDGTINITSSVVTLTRLETQITISASNEDCEDFKYMCVKASHTGNLTDSDSTNNYLCLNLNDLTDDQILFCKGCITQVSLVLLSLVIFINLSM